MASTAADVLIESLQDWGVEIIFGLPGDGINGIMEALRRRQDLQIPLNGFPSGVEFDYRRRFARSGYRPQKYPSFLEPCRSEIYLSLLCLGQLNPQTDFP